MVSYGMSRRVFYVTTHPLLTLALLAIRRFPAHRALRAVLMFNGDLPNVLMASFASA